MAKENSRSGGWPMKHDRELIMLAKTHTAQTIAEKFERSDNDDRQSSRTVRAFDQG